MSTTEKLARKMHKGYFLKAKEQNIFKVPHQTKQQRWADFTIDKKVAMVYDVVVSKEKVTDVAKKYNRSKGWVSTMVKKAK